MVPSVTRLGNNRPPKRASIRTRTTSFARTRLSRGLTLGWRWMVAEAVVKSVRLSLAPRRKRV